MLARAGVGLPKTIFTNFSKNVEHVIECVGGAPVVLKLLEGTQGLGVILADTQNAAGSVMEAFNGLEARIIVQEFIKEAGGADIRAFVVDGVVVGAMKRQGKEGEFRSNLHRGGSANIIELSDEEENAALIAVRETQKALLENRNMERVLFVCFNEETRKAYDEALQEWE